MNTGFMVIKNGIKLGYPFVESIASMHTCCDKFVIFDCGSDDGTAESLESLCNINTKFLLVKIGWPDKSALGNAIAVATNNAVRHPVLNGSRKLFYVQADEVYHENDEKELKKSINSESRSVSFKFIHFRNGFLQFIINPTYDRAIRIIPANGAQSIQDGFNFSGNINPVLSSNIRIYHVGWCFPYHICQKHINHAKLYPGCQNYENARRICQEMLAGEIKKHRLDKEIDNNYRFGTFDKNKMPKYLKHLYSMSKYDPAVGLKTLENDLKRS